VLLLLLLCMASLLFGCPVCVLAWPFFSLMDDPVSRPVAMTEKGRSSSTTRYMPSPFYFLHPIDMKQHKQPNS
jgi:hypothetical protein